MRSLLALAAAFLVSLAILVDSAQAQEANGGTPTESDLRARRYFEAGNTRYDDGDYEGAAADFERAYELSHRTGLLFNLYLVEERRGHLEAAADYLDRYIAANPTLEGREQMLIRLQNLRERIERERAGGAPHATTTAPAESSSAIPTGAWISWGAAAAGVVTFGVFGAMALSENASLRDTCGTNAGRICTDDDVSALRRNDLIADIGLGVAIAGTITGFVILWVSGGDRDAEPTPVAVAPWITQSGGGAAMRLSL